MVKVDFSRFWYGAIALSVLAVILLQSILNYGEAAGQFAEPYARVFNMFWFFTIQSNILVGISSYILAKDPLRETKIFLVIKTSALIAITVTGVVYHLLLAADSNNTGLNVLTDFFLHTLIPLAYVLGWLFFNVRKKLTWSIAWLSLVFPILWTIAVMIRGPIVDYYPYPFMDVRDLGYAKALTTMAFVTLFFVFLVVLYKMVDKLLAKIEK